MSDTPFNAGRGGAPGNPAAPGNQAATGNQAAPDASNYGPLGPGHAPAKDPMKGLRGVMSAVLIMEAISLLLVLTVILQINDGNLWTPFNIWYTTGVGVAHVIAALLQRFPFAVPLTIILQVAALAGFVVHWSFGATALIFIAVWIFLFYLRSVIVQRMARGLLTTQHS